MLQLASQCFVCLNDLVIKSGQCETCKAPPLELLDSEDLLPLQFLYWCSGEASLSDLVEASKHNTVLIDFPKPQISEDRYKLLLEEFSPALAKYIEFTKGGADSVAQSGMGINPVPMTTEASEKIRLLRELIFRPITQALAKAQEKFAPLNAEFAMLEPHLHLKDIATRAHKVLLIVQSFKVVYSAHARERLQCHFDFGHKSVQKMVSEDGDGFGKLRALQRYAFFSDVDHMATMILFLKTGEAFGEFKDLLASMEFARGVANPNGHIRPLSDAFSLETIVHLLGWRSFRRIDRLDKPTPVRSLIDLESIRRTIAVLRGQHPVIDLYIGLAFEESGEPTDLVASMDAAANVDGNFALSRLLIKRPLDLEGLKSLIIKNPEMKMLGWMVGWNDRETRLPGIEKLKIDDADMGDLHEAVRVALDSVKKYRKPVLTEKMLADVRKQAVEYPLQRAEWERSEFPATLKNNLLQLLIFHETNHATLCQAVSMLTAPAETFWLRSEIQLDAELFTALTGKDEWGYRVQTFLSSSVDSAGHKPDVLKVDPAFLDLMHEWMLQFKPGNVSDLQKLWSYLEQNVAIHKSAEVLEHVFASWLRRMAGNAKIYPSDALLNLTALSRARAKSLPDSRPVGAYLESTVKSGEAAPWRAGLLAFVTDQAHARLEVAAALSMKMLMEQESLLPALRKEIGDQEYINKLMDILMMSNLNDAGLFMAYFHAAEPLLRADPSPNRLKKLRSRATGASFIENKAIQDFVLNFVNEFPDAEKAEAEEKAKAVAAERAAEQAHLKSKLSAVDEMIAKLDEAYQINLKAEQKAMQDKLAAASAKLSASLTSGDAGKIAEAQVIFTGELQTIQDEGTKKIMALADGLQQAKTMLRKIS